MYDDKELKEYRNLLKTPEHFEEGFNWKTVVGAIFIGFLMMPGSMYLQLVIGTGILLQVKKEFESLTEFFNE